MAPASFSMEKKDGTQPCTLDALLRDIGLEKS